MSGPDFVVVELDDWAALYVNGEKVPELEGHSLPLEATINYILKEHDMKPVVFKWCSPEFENDVVMNAGRLPDTLPEPDQLC